MKICYCKRESPNGSSKNERQILDTSDIFQLLYFLKDTLHSNPFKTYFKNLTRKLSLFKFTYFYALFYIKSFFYTFFANRNHAKISHLIY